MSKIKGKPSESDQLMTQGWHTLVDTIRLLPLYPKSSAPSNDAEREHDLAVAVAEKHTLDDAVDQVALLIRLRKGEVIPPFLLPTLTAKAPCHSMYPLPLPPSSSSSSAAAAAAGTASAAATVNSPAPPQTAGVKRKHRVSVSASPAPAALGPGRDGLAPLTTSSSSRHASPMPGTGRSTAHRQAKPITKKEMMQDQLPLKPGRKVAYESQDESGQPLWILCTVISSIPGEKHGYVVEDDDEEMLDENSKRHNTTIHSLLPLPDSSLPSTSLGHPDNLEDWPIDSHCLALYPDSTVFYSSTVKSAPAPGTGHGLGLRGGAPKKKDPEALPGKYRLLFVEEEVIRTVHKDMVVPYPLYNA